MVLDLFNSFYNYFFTKEDNTISSNLGSDYVKIQKPVSKESTILHVKDKKTIKKIEKRHIPMKYKKRNIKHIKINRIFQPNRFKK